MSDTRDFAAAIETRLAAAAERGRHHRHHTETRMAERLARLAAFRTRAAPLIQILHQRVRKLASYFENARVLGEPDSMTSVVHFEHTARFPASVKLSLGLAFDEAREQVTITYDLEILPILVEYQRSDELVLPLADLDGERARAFVEDKLVQCLETYLALETSPRYHRTEMAVDPVCGMKIRKAEAVRTYQRGARVLYFCANACYEHFVANVAEPTADARSEH